MLKVQEYLRTHSLQQLEEEHGVNHRFSADGTKFSLNYDQITAKSDNPIACECRGLVVRPRITEHLTTSSVAPNGAVGPTDILARCMNRFFNAGDTHAANINWSTARIEEKVDGTMILLYWDSVKNQWCVATRSVPEADVSFGDPPGSPLIENTFYHLFMYSAARTLTAEPSISSACADVDSWLFRLDCKFTYIFELTSPLNRVVVKYDDFRITLLCARETATGAYMHHDRLHEVGVPVVQEWPLKTLADIEDFLHHSDPAKVEGAVVVDSHNNRVKVKSKQWVLASRMKDSVSMSKRNALEAVIDGTIDDVIPLMDLHVQEYLKEMQWKTANYLLLLDDTFYTIRRQPDRKSFALAVQASNLWQTPLFNLYSGKWSSSSEWLQDLSRNKKLTDSMLDTMLQIVDRPLPPGAQK